MENSKRDTGLDAVRALAIVMVTLIHAAGPVLSALPPGEGDWWAALLWSGPARMAVPLFFMCSGALMLSRPVSGRRLLCHNLPRILTAMFFWSFVYRLMDLYDAGALNGAGIWGAVKATLLFQHEFHFYYLHILLVVYAFLPALGVFVRAATRRELEYLLGVWLVVGSSAPSCPPSGPSRWSPRCRLGGPWGWPSPVWATPCWAIICGNSAPPSPGDGSLPLWGQGRRSRWAAPLFSP